MTRGIWLAFLILFAVAAHGQPESNSDDNGDAPGMCEPGSDVECGWFWKRRLPDPEEKPKPRPKPKPKPTNPPRSADQDKVDCTDEDEWRATCGFTDPGKSFSFQAKQRDKLRDQMIMQPNNPKAVRGYQEYTNWMLNQAIAAARMWKFNNAQNPELDTIKDRPTSRFGLKLLKREKDATTDKIYQLIREEGGFFVFFSRSDCPYCHDLLPILSALEQDTGIGVSNASLDEKCLEGFDDAHCVTGEKSRRPAAKLKVRTVPDLMLYLPNDNTWIRLITGVRTLPIIKSRLKLFVSGMRSAYENAVTNSQNDYSPSVDFKDKALIQQSLGMGKGVDQDGKQ